MSLVPAAAERNIKTAMVRVSDDIRYEMEL